MDISTQRVKLINQNEKTGGGGVVKRHVGLASIDNSASHGPYIYN